MASAGTDGGESISLNLNPMLDIFSILITFLLMSFSTDPVNHDLRENMELPDSDTLVALDEVPLVSANREAVYYGDKKVADIINGEVPKEFLQQDAIYPLWEELKALAAANKQILKAVGKEKETGSLTLEIDKGHNFLLMKQIMHAGKEEEFIKYKLMVAKEMQ